MLTKDQAEKTAVAILLTADEVAALLHISERSVWRLTSSGELPKPIKLGHSCRWSRKSIEQFVQQKVAEMAA